MKLSNYIKRKKSLRTEYIYQTISWNSYQCGSFVLYNTLIRLNRQPDLNVLIRLCNADQEEGTDADAFNNAITFINESENVRIVPTEPKIKNIQNIILQGESIIILFHWEENDNNGEHFAMIETTNDYYSKSNREIKFKIINYSFDEPIKWVDTEELKILLLPFVKKQNNGKIYTYPKIWYCCDAQQ